MQHLSQQHIVGTSASAISFARHRFGTRSLCALLLTVAAGASFVVSGVAQAQPVAAKATDEAPDEVILRSGKTFKGKVISETATTVKFKGVVDGISFETEFSKTDVLKVIRGTPTATDAATAADAKKTADSTKSASAGSDTKKADTSAVSASDQVRFYWITLEGHLGEEITQTPLREAINDARANNCQTIIIDYRPAWVADERDPLPELMSNFDEMFRAEPLAEIFTDDLRKDWPVKPRVVFWIKNAMGGAAMLPLVCPEVYFTSTATLGGLGNLGRMFDGVGDEVVRLKQRSLRMGHAEGWTLAGGYDFRLIRAMSYPNYVLSYRMTDGKPDLFEDYPSNPGEELLTDDGKETNADSLQAILRGVGNDVLNIDARLGEILGINRKTVDSKDDLLAAMEIAITGVEVPGRSKNIMRDWTTGLDNTKRQLKKLRQDFDDVRVQDPGDFGARSKARGQRRTMLEQMLRLQKGRFGEGLTARWLYETRIPDELVIGIELETIRIEQTKDRK